MFGLKDTIIVDNDFNALEDGNNIINNDTEIGVVAAALETIMKQLPEQQPEMRSCRNFRYASSPSMAKSALLAIIELFLLICDFWFYSQQCSDHTHLDHIFYCVASIS